MSKTMAPIFLGTKEPDVLQNSLYCTHLFNLQIIDLPHVCKENLFVDKFFQITLCSINDFYLVKYISGEGGLHSISEITDDIET